MSNLRKLSTCAALYLITGLTTALAMTVSPMQVEMTTVGARSRGQVFVVNNSNEPLPIEAMIERLTLDESGKPQISKAGEDFLVMPPQAIIPPGATQNFRVQWLGEPDLAKSESFVLSLNQVPVKLSGQSGVQVVMGLGVMINVAPPQGLPALKVVSTGVTSDKSGRRRPTITVENVSNVHALLPQGTIELASGGWSASLPPQSTSDEVGIGLVQPGKQRKFTLPVDLPAGITSVAASVVFNPRR